MPQLGLEGDSSRVLTLSIPLYMFDTGATWSMFLIPKSLIWKTRGATLKTLPKEEEADVNRCIRLLTLEQLWEWDTGKAFPSHCQHPNHTGQFPACFSTGRALTKFVFVWEAHRNSLAHRVPVSPGYFPTFHPLSWVISFVLFLLPLFPLPGHDSLQTLAFRGRGVTEWHRDAPSPPAFTLSWIISEANSQHPQPPAFTTLLQATLSCTFSKHRINIFIKL